jgi:hypothetical protein
MCVKGAKPFSPDLKSLESSVQEPSMQRARGDHCYALPGGALCGIAPLEPDKNGNCSAPGKPPGVM